MAHKYCVYKHTSPSGKVYIGITGQNPLQRWRHGEGYAPGKNGKPTAFYKAIQKYGWNNFKHEILLDGLTKEEACRKEIELIREYKAQDRKHGYNELKGGDVPMADCPETVREKMRESAYQKWERPEYVEGHTGANHWTAGGNYSQKAIDAMKKANTGKKRTPEQVEALREKGRNQTRLYGKDNKHSKAVLCLTTSGELVKKYYGLMDAYRETGISFQNISKACHGKYKSAGGYKWRFEDAYQAE